MSIIGLTGPTGAGKSTVRVIAENLGFYTVDCDKEARFVTNEDEVLNALAEAFGEDISVNGELDRKLLAVRAFSSKEKTEALNKIVLPAVCRRIEALIKGKKNVLLDAPTLFESGIDRICNVTVGVLASEGCRRERITKRDNLSKENADVRLSAAKPDEFFKERCDYIIENNGCIAELKIKAEEILSKYVTEE